MAPPRILGISYFIHKPNPFEVRVDDVFPVFFRALGSRRQLSQDSGVMVGVVQSAIGSDNRVDHRFNFTRLGHIYFCENSGTAGFSDDGFCFFASLNS